MQGLFQGVGSLSLSYTEAPEAGRKYSYAHHQVHLPAPHLKLLSLPIALIEYLLR